jgi:hypothetical protein
MILVASLYGLAGQRTQKEGPSHSPRRCVLRRLQGALRGNADCDGVLTSGDNRWGKIN